MDLSLIVFSFHFECVALFFSKKNNKNVKKHSTLTSMRAVRKWMRFRYGYCWVLFICSLHTCECECGACVCVSAHFFSVNLDTSICGLHKCCITYIIVVYFAVITHIGFRFCVRFVSWVSISSKDHHQPIRQNQRWNCYRECAFCASVDLVIYSFFSCWCPSLHAIAFRYGCSVAFFLSFETHRHTHHTIYCIHTKWKFGCGQNFFFSPHLVIASAFQIHTYPISQRTKQQYFTYYITV